MGNGTLKKLEHYKTSHQLTDTELANRLGVYRNYLFRWRRGGRITGAYKRIVDDFLVKAQGNGTKKARTP